MSSRKRSLRSNGSRKLAAVFAPAFGEPRNQVGAYRRVEPGPAGEHRAECAARRGTEPDLAAGYAADAHKRFRDARVPDQHGAGPERQSRPQRRRQPV